MAGKNSGFCNITITQTLRYPKSILITKCLKSKVIAKVLITTIFGIQQFRDTLTIHHIYKTFIFSTHFCDYGQCNLRGYHCYLFCYLHFTAGIEGIENTDSGQETLTQPSQKSFTSRFLSPLFFSVIMRSVGESFALFLVFIFIMCSAIIQPTVGSVTPSNDTSAPAIQFQKIYGTGRTEYVSNLIQTSDGGYAFLDCGKSYQTLFVPSTLFKLDSSGNMQWNKTINLFTASNIIQTSDGGLEVAGEWNTYGTTYQTTPAIIKLNSKGDMQWYENTSSVLNLATAASSIQTSDGGFAYFEAGNAVLNPPTATVPPTLVKTDSNNNTQWIDNLPYSGPANYENGIIWFPFKIFSIIETSDGALASLGIADPMLTPQGLWGYIYLIKTAQFLPSPSQSPLSTPLPSPTPTPTTITVTEIILIIALISVVVFLSIVRLIYRRQRKNQAGQETLTTLVGCFTNRLLSLCSSKSTKRAQH